MNYTDVWKMRNHIAENLHEFPWHVFRANGQQIDPPSFAPPYITAVRILNLVKGTNIPETVESWYIKQYKEGNYDLSPIVDVINITNETQGIYSSLSPADKLAKVLIDNTAIRDYIGNRLNIKEEQWFKLSNWEGVSTEEFQIT